MLEPIVSVLKIRFSNQSATASRINKCLARTSDYVKVSSGLRRTQISVEVITSIADLCCFKGGECLKRLPVIFVPGYI